MSEKLYSHQTLSVGSSTVHVGFTNTAAGNLGLHVGNNLAEVLENRAALETDLGLEGQGFVYLNQVHGTEVFDADLNSVITASEETQEQGIRVRDSAPVADAAVSVTGMPLAVMVADCIPVVLVGITESAEPILAVAHAGRRGLLDGVLQQTVGEMVAQGAQNIEAWLGPSICGSCYEVPEVMRTESVENLPEVFAETSWSTSALDLPAGARAVLESLPQVSRVHQELSDCTLENSSLYSHRRGDSQGRIAGLVWIEK